MALRSLDEIEVLTDRALRTCGAAESVAASVAHAVRVAEGYGNKICGLYYVESYCLQLGTGRVLGDVAPEVSAPKPAAICVDARMGFAQPAFAAGLPRTMEAAKRYGTASLAIAHAHTCTSLGYFTEQIARAGFLGLGFTNASPIVAAPGGKTRVLGTNPISFAVPDGDGGIAMQFDQSTTTVALGKITMAKAMGQNIPEGWALDAAGQPTTCPEAALNGSLVSAGGYKGWGFGLLAEVLAAVLTGSTLSRNVNPLKSPGGAPHNLGQYYIVIDPEHAPDFSQRMLMLERYVAFDQGTRMPGQNKQITEHVEITDAVWNRLEELAQGL
ncbi:MAG: Ldh family oxidoreductase [Pseudomonadota bacterium]